MNPEINLLGLASAVGIGLLIGIERERRKGEGPSRHPAGLRTFILASLLGALATLIGGEWMLVAFVLVIGALAVAAYLRSSTQDPGLTTEMAMLVTFLLGALAMRDTVLATGLGVVVAVLLTARDRLHRFVRQVITEGEIHDGLLLAAAALVILPLTPDRAVGPYEVLNPRTLWALAVLMMAINAAGYVALRAFGPRVGLPLAGFASGFVSSSATIAAMAARSRSHPELRRGAVAGAVLSSCATVVQLAVVLGATSPPALQAAALPLVAAGVVAVAYGALFAWRNAVSMSDEPVAPGRAFDPRLAVTFAAAIGVVLLLVAAAADAMGSAGLAIAVGLAGFADVHSPVAAIGAMQAGGGLVAADAVLPVLIAFTANSVTKVVIAAIGGDRGYALRVIPGVVMMVAAAWVAGWLSGV